MSEGRFERLERYSADRVALSGLSAGIARAFDLPVELIRFGWLLLYVLSTAAMRVVRAGVLEDGPIGWVYVGWLLTGGSPAVFLYTLAWSLIPNADGRRTIRPLVLWALLCFVPLALMTLLAWTGA
jgi:phage shock protein PspC (stress-responsive transcriptional regulator)